METQEKNNLEKYFKSIREENYKESFDEVENWLRKETAYTYSKPEKSRFSFLKYIFSEGKLKYAYLFIILILVGITSNFSVTRTEPVGIVMSWSVDKQNPEAIKKIDNFDWIDKSKLVVDENDVDGKQVLTYKILMPSSTPEEIEILKNELHNIKDIHSVNIIPISEPVKQPLYAVALEKVFNVDYAKNLANPEDIKNNVFEQLKYAGIQNDVNLSVVPISSAGKYVSFDFGKKPDSIRIKLHNDALNDYYIEKTMAEVDELLVPMKVINDSILNKVVVRINGENVVPEIIISQVQKNLDTLHLLLKKSEIKRKERMDRFNEKMERFNERMERFNKKMEKVNEKLKDLKIKEFKYDYEVDEDGDIKIDIDIDDIPGVDEVPEIDENNLHLKFDIDELNNNLNIKIDTANIHIDMEKIHKEVKENMEKVKEEMKKLNEELKKDKLHIDTSGVRYYYHKNDDKDDENYEKEKYEIEEENDED